MTMVQIGIFAILTFPAALVHFVLCDAGMKIEGPGQYETEPGEFPYMAVILEKSTRKLITSGVLMAPNAVLTVAVNYFIFNDVRPEDITIVLGTHNRSEEERSRQEFGAVEIIAHPEFFETGFSNSNFSGDLALIKLDRNARINRRVQVFPSKNIARTSNQDSRLIGTDRCVVAGYGKIKDNAYEVIYPRTLRAFVPQMVKHNTCRNFFSTVGYRLSKESWMCSKNDDGTEIRAGDGGNPLLCSTKQGYRLHAISSGGSDSIGLPASERLGIVLYVRLSKYRSWILDSIKLMKIGQYMKKT